MSSIQGRPEARGRGRARLRRRPGEALLEVFRARVPLDVLSDTIQPFPVFSTIYLPALKALRSEIAAGLQPVGRERLT